MGGLEYVRPRAMVGYFVTGTDTGVGKTYVTRALAERGRARGTRVFAWKPIETGCVMVEGELRGEDQEGISSDWQRGELRGLYRFARPVAPWVAARGEGRAIEVRGVLDVLREGAQGAGLVLVEGAGGWRVPVSERIDMAALAKEIGLPVLVAARGGLGTINHSLLTVEAVERDGQKVAAVVLSCRSDDDRGFVEENAEEIRRRFDGRVITLWNDAAVLDELL